MPHILLGSLSPIWLKAKNDYWTLATERFWNFIVPVMSLMMPSAIHTSKWFVMFGQILRQIKSWWRRRFGRERERYLIWYFQWTCAFVLYGYARTKDSCCRKEQPCCFFSRAVLVWLYSKSTQGIESIKLLQKEITHFYASLASWER